MTTGIPLTIVSTELVPEPLASILRLLRQIRWHISEDAMNQATAKSAIADIRYLLDNPEACLSEHVGEILEAL